MALTNRPSRQSLIPEQMPASPASRYTPSPTSNRTSPGVTYTSPSVTRTSPGVTRTSPGVSGYQTRNTYSRAGMYPGTNTVSGQSRVRMSSRRRRPGKRRRRISFLKDLLKGLGLLLLLAVLILVFFFLKEAFMRSREETEAKNAVVEDSYSYPLEYESIIREQAKQFDLDPAHVAAVIYCESSFRPTAVSSVGAVGLMQLLPSTAEWIAKKLKEPSFEPDSLTDPETNIRYGCWYLRFLSNQFQNDLSCVSAAYHAGQGTVSKWLDNPEYSQDGKTLTRIPGEVTSAYVEKISHMMDVYRNILD